MLPMRRLNRRRRFVFRTVPDGFVAPADARIGLWRSLGASPAFKLEAPGARLPRSWVLLDVEMTMPEGTREPILQVNEGAGFDRGKSIYLPQPEDGRSRAVVLLPAKVHELRLDLRGWAGEFRLGKVSMREIGKAELGVRSALPVARSLVRDPRQMPGFLRRGLALIRTEGLQVLKNRLAGTDREIEEYGRWIERFDVLDTQDVALIRQRIQELPRRPRISVIMPVYNAPERWLRRAIDSVLAQSYPDWQLCIADDASTDVHVRGVLEEYATRDPRITPVFRERNGHISEASNSALAAATGEFVALLDHDDEIAPHALYLIAEEVNARPDVDLIYSDEDKIDESGRRYEAYFKPDWSPDLIGSQNLFSHLGVYRTALVRKVGGFRSGLDGSQDYDLALRCERETRPDRIRHIPSVLYHWRAIETSTASGGAVKRYAFTAARRALEERFARDDPRVTVSFGRYLALYRVRFPLPAPPARVSLIVAASGTSEQFRRQVVSLLLRTDYPDLELLVVADAAGDPAMIDVLRDLETRGWARVLRVDQSLNHAARMNLAASQATGTVLALLDWTLQPVDQGWLGEMVSQCVRPGLGAVGAKLLARTGEILHAGTVLALDDIAQHPHRGLPGNAHGYFGRAQAIQNYSAVSGDCLVVRREVFEQVGGFDSANLPGWGSDIDFCLRVREAGHRNLWTPYAELRRSAAIELSPGEHRKAAAEASEYLRKRWGPILSADPYHSPNLALDGGHHVLAWPPRRRRPWRDQPPSAVAGSPESSPLAPEEDGESLRGPIVTVRPPLVGDATPVRMFTHGGRDQIAREFAEKGWSEFEQPLPDVFAACVIHSTGLILDVGANTGFYTLLALACSGACRVHAFEPLGPIADLLDDNLVLNGATDRVKVFRQALGDRRGNGQLFIPEASHGLIETSASLDRSFKKTLVGTTAVPITTIDHHWLDMGGVDRGRSIEIIKIDVESLEANVLSGGARVLEEHRPLVFLEVLPGTDAARLEALRRLHRYLVVRLQPDRAIVAKELSFDAAGWNQMLVPTEKAEHWLATISQFLTLETE